MSEIMPLIESPLWLDAEDYTFPGIREVHAEIDEENERHERSLAALAQKLQELKAGEQAGFQKLLTARGPELRDAVVQALRYLDFARVVDVDDYWKHVIRTKEED